MTRRQLLRTRSGAVAISGMAIFVGLFGCEPSTAPPARPNVVLVVVDSLRADGLGSYGYDLPTSPGIDALAKDSLRFEHAYATAPWTMPSVASIMTGLYPSSHGLQQGFRTLRDDLPTLAEILRENGYRTSGVVSHGLLSKNYGFDRGFEQYSSEYARGHNYRSTYGVTRRALAELQSMAPNSRQRPFFLFVHYFDPHFAWLPHPGSEFAMEPQGRLRGDEPISELIKIHQDLHEPEIAFLRSRYDGEVRHTDRGIRRVMEELRDLDLYQDTLIIVTADHGEEFMEHGWLGHTRLLYDTQIRVPLLIRPPRFDGEARTIESSVSLVSIVPTILETSGIDPEPYALQGHSLASTLADGSAPADQLLFAEVDYRKHATLRSNKRAAIAHPFKLIVDRLTGQVELFDIHSDPQEKNDLRAERPELADRLEAALAELGDAPAGTEAELSEDLRDSLRSLGYIE